MGMCVGRVNEEQPTYKKLFTSATGMFEIREYGKQLIAETTTTADNGRDGSFGRLAKYIGVFSTPNNANSTGESEAISMTAPVMMQKPGGGGGASGVAAANGERTMAFVLPASKYQSLDDVPKPTDPAVTVREVAPRCLAVRTFSGNISSSWTQENLTLLLHDMSQDEAMTKEGWHAVGTDASSDLMAGDHTKMNWYLAGYNAPFVLGCFKTNEVMVEVARKQL